MARKPKAKTRPRKAPSAKKNDYECYCQTAEIYAIGDPYKRHRCDVCKGWVMPGKPVNLHGGSYYPEYDTSPAPTGPSPDPFAGIDPDDLDRIGLKRP